MKDGQTEMTPKAVVLLSGGLDSATTAAIAKAEGYELYALSFDYGQRHRIELESAKKVAAALGAKKHLVISFNLRDIGGSALTADIDVPKQQGQEQKGPGAGVQGPGKKAEANCSELVPCPMPPDPVIIPITYVPARNTIFLSFALSWAETLQAADIFIGANAVDYSGYPDCRPEYLRAFEEMANLATKISVEGTLRFKVHAPLLQMTKSEIVKRGAELGLDYSLTWSCYDPQEQQGPSGDSPDSTTSLRSSVNTGQSPVLRHETSQVSILDLAPCPMPLAPAFASPPAFLPCGRCDSCLFRAKGFEEAGVIDPAVRTRQ